MAAFFFPWNCVMAKSKTMEADQMDEIESPRFAACIGLPVHYHTPHETLPATLQRRSLTNPELWDLKISLSGATIPSMRSSVQFSETPKVGCWSYMPGFGG